MRADYDPNVYFGQRITDSQLVTYMLDIYICLQNITLNLEQLREPVKSVETSINCLPEL